jgi:hypothetical protein
VRIRTSARVAAKERRLNEKKKRTAVKQSRAKGDWE